MLIIVVSFSRTYFRFDPVSSFKGRRETMLKRKANWYFLRANHWFCSQATGGQLNRLLKSELQKGYCMPRGSESQQNNTALFSNNECVNGQELMLTVDLLHV